MRTDQPELGRPDGKPAPRRTAAVGPNAGQQRHEEMHLRVRPIARDEPVALLAGRRAGTEAYGMSRAAPRYLGGTADRFAFAVERIEAGRAVEVVAVGQCDRDRGAHAARVSIVSEPGPMQWAAIASVIERIVAEASARGIHWLRWRLREPELGIIDAVRRVAAEPVLHREGSTVVAEVALPGA